MFNERYEEFEKAQKAKILASYGLAPDGEPLEKGLGDKVGKMLDKHADQGEGSRGGKVIGHTRSGKAVYADVNPASQKGEHKYRNFDSNDHIDAHNLHKEEAEKRQSQHTHEGGEHHKRAATTHRTYGDHHRTQAKAKDHSDYGDSKLSKGGEGSRGGHVIGHTKSGKPVYVGHADHADYKNFSSQDHLDAAELHRDKAKHHHFQAENKPMPTDGSSDAHASWMYHHNKVANDHKAEAKKKGGSNGYVGFTHTGKRVEVYANTLHEAVQKIREEHKVPKSQHHRVHAMLAEKDGEQVTHSTAGIG